MRKLLLIVAILLMPVVATGTVYFTEEFEDTNFSARSWYDAGGAGGAVSSTAPHGGSGSFYCAFGSSATTCTGGDLKRKKFTATNSVYVSFWIKLSSNWVGSQLTYHPHIFYLMTDADASDYEGMYGSETTAYLEVLGAIPQIGMQDGANINTSYIGTDLCGVSETRAAHGCNGLCDSNTWEVQDCYDAGPAYVNGRWTRASSGMSLNEWHRIEAFFQMNTITASVADYNGKMMLWVDGVNIKNYQDLVYRTNAQANMKWDKIILSPYIGDGSPIAQGFYIDDLQVADNQPEAVNISGCTLSGVSIY